MFMKYIPVPYRVQLNAKAASGLVVSLAGTVLFAAVLQILFAAPVYVFLGALMLMLPGGVFINYMGLFIDVVNPKLTWDNEQRAIKQNINAMALMFSGMLFSAAVGVLSGLFLTAPLIAFLVLFVLLSVLAAGASQFVLTVGEERMEGL
jgi:ABC-2 type transport system permease protein